MESLLDKYNEIKLISTSYIENKLSVNVLADYSIYSIEFDNVAGFYQMDEVYTSIKYTELIEGQRGWIKVIQQKDSPCENIFGYNFIAQDTSLKHYIICCRDHTIHAICRDEPKVKNTV